METVDNTRKLINFVAKNYRKHVKIVDRKYIIGGKWLRFQKMQGVKLVGWKIAIGRYEIRFYLK